MLESITFIISLITLLLVLSWTVIILAVVKKQLNMKKGGGKTNGSKS